MTRERNEQGTQATPTNTNLTITTIPAILKLFSDPKIPDYSDVQEG